MKTRTAAATKKKSAPPAKRAVKPAPKKLVAATRAAPAAKRAASPFGEQPPANETRPLIYVNGEYLPKNKAMVSVYDHGLLYGDGVFEGIRVYRGRIFKLRQHMDRIWKCAAQIGLEIPLTRAQMIEMQRRCIRENNITEGYIRLLVTRGYGTLGLDPRKCPKAGVICIADQIHLYPADLYEKGMRVVVANRPRIPVACLDPRIKSLNYLNNILAKMEAIRYGCHEVIMLNTEGFVAECSGDNIFVVKNGRVYTPPCDAGALEGITREFVMKLAPQNGVPCEERMMRIEDVLTADEVFLTGTAAEMIAVTEVDGHDGERITHTTRISEGEGPITRRLRAAFRTVVTRDPVPEE